jgi:hypothetical protein
MRQRSRQPDWGQRLNKSATLSEYLLKERELDNSFKLNRQRAKGSLPEKKTTVRKELLTLTPGNVADGRSWSQWRWWWVRTSQADHKSMWQHFGVLRVKCQEANLNRWPCAYTCIQHQTRDTETDSQRNTHDGSSGWPGALLENSIFYRWIAVCNILHILLGLGKTTNSQDRFPGIQHCLHLVLLSHKLK